jgi:hypothetical protein
MIIMCSVCFSGADPMARAGLNAGIIVLLGVTAAVLGCFACFFIRLARRSRAAAHLVGEPESFLEPGFDAGSLGRSVLEK